jgi:enamine deaminase RidA (YjgF/YER057c/UK114 family)
MRGEDFRIVDEAFDRKQKPKFVGREPPRPTRGRIIMEKRLINPPGLPQPRGFNHGVLTSGGRLLFMAGQDPSGADGKIVSPGDLVAQFEQVIRNLKAVAEAAGGGVSDIVKLNIFVKSRDDYKARLKELGRIYRSYFGDYYPAMALFEVSDFFQPEALVEIEGIAVIAE